MLVISYQQTGKTSSKILTSNNFSQAKEASVNKQSARNTWYRHKERQLYQKLPEGMPAYTTQVFFNAHIYT